MIKYERFLKGENIVEENNVLKEKNSIIKNLEVDIDALEETLKQSKNINFKRSVVKNLKLYGTFIRFIFPIALVTTATFTIAENNNFTPVIRDDQKVCQSIKTVFDNRGDESHEYQYEDYPTIDNTLNIQGAWHINDKNNYEREHRIYQISADDIAQIKELINDEEALQEHLGEPKTTIIYETKNLTEEEKEEKPYVKVTTYGKDENNCITAKESTLTNFANTIFYCVGNAALSIIVMTRKPFKMNFIENAKRIIEENRPISEFLLKRKIEIKQENYETLTGNRYVKRR